MNIHRTSGRHSGSPMGSSLNSPGNAHRTETRISWSQLPVAIIAMAFFFSVAAHAEPSLGDARAPVTIVEYGSLTCGYCVRFHREVFPLIKSRHIDTGRVRFVYRDFPTGAAATRGAIAARCAGLDQYYTMLNALFVAVGQWSRARDVDAALIQQATSLGMDDVAFRACLKDPRHMRKLRDDQRRATHQYTVLGTPTFLINGRIVTGIQTIDEMEVLMEEALAATREQNADVDTERVSPVEQ